VEKKQTEKSLHLKTGSPSTAGERAVHMILAAMTWVKDLLASFKGVRPVAQVIHHQGRALATADNVRFARILVVEDNVQTAKSIADTLGHYYTFGDVTIYIATCFQSALSFFGHEDIQLVIMDSDLHDELGDGFALLEKFVIQKPGVVILANSSSRMANMKMVSGGARAGIGKSYEKLQSWLLANDRAGNDG
jgi:CheY-like chemotaxis protein